MKKVKIKKVIAILMALVTCMGVFGISSFAAMPEENLASPQNIVIGATDNSLTLSTSGVLTCYGATSVQVGYIAKVKVELQRKDETWTTIQTWTDGGNASSAALRKNYAVVAADEDYRLKVTHEAYTSSTSTSPYETITKYSEVISY